MQKRNLLRKENISARKQTLELTCATKFPTSVEKISCIAASPHKATRTVSVDDINRQFSELNFVDYFFMDEVCLKDFMEAY